MALKVDLYDRANAFQGTLTGARLAAVSRIENQDGAASFQIHRADPDAAAQTSSATNAAAVAQAHLTFTVAPTGFVPGQKVVVDYGTSTEEEAVILSGAGTTDWILAENLTKNHVAGYTVYSGPLRGKWDGFLVHVSRKGPLDTIYIDRGYWYRVEDVTLGVDDQEEAGAWLNVSGRGTLSLLEDRMIYPPGFDGASATSILSQWQIYSQAPGGSIMAGEIDRSNPRFGLQLTHSRDTGTAYSSPVLADAPVAWYRLNDTGASAVDLGSGAHNGTLHGTITKSVPGALSPDPDTAMKFNGSTGYIDAGLPTAATAAWSLEGWIKPATFDVAAPQIAVFNGQGAADGYGFGIGGAGGVVGTHLMALFQGVAWVDSGYVFKDVNRWYHVVVTYDNVSLRFYVNGAIQATIAQAAPTAPTGGSYIGRDTVGRYFNGAIDEVSIYTTTLSAARVTAHYGAGSSFYQPVSDTTVPQTVKLRFDNMRKLHDFLVSNGMDAMMVGLDYQPTDHLGTDRSSTVRLRLSSRDSLRGTQLERSSRPIKNFVVAQGTGEGINAKLAISSDSLSISAYSRREGFLDASQVDDQTQLGLQASSAITQLKDPDQRIIVPFVDSAVTRLYEHFNLGDTIMLDNPVLGWVAPYRVVGITIADTEADREEITLDLSDMRQELLMRVQTGQQLTADGLNVINRMPQGSAFNDSKGYPDNCDATHPFHFKFFLPSNLLQLNAAKLSFTLLAFRRYEAGLSTVTSAASSASSSSAGSAHHHTMQDHLHRVFHYVSNVAAGWARQNYTIGLPLGLTGSVDLEVDPTVTSDLYSDTMSVVGNTADEGAHTHPIPHTHDVTPTFNDGIFEGATATGVTVKVNGVDRTAALGGGTGFTADQAELEVFQWLNIGAWNTIDLTPSGLGRIDADIRMTGYVQAV